MAEQGNLHLGNLTIGIKALDETGAVFQSIANNVTALNSSISQTAKQFQKVTEGASKVATKVGKDMNTVITQTRRAQSQIGGFANQVAHYLTFTIGVQLVFASVKAMKDTIELATNIEASIVKATAVSRVFGKAFDETAQAIKESIYSLSLFVPASLKDIASAFVTIGQAGYNVRDLLKEDLVPTMQYAAVQQLSFSDALQNVITAMKIYHFTFKDTERIVDAFTNTVTRTLANAESLASALKYVGPVAYGLNVDFEELIATLGILINAGVEGSQAGQMLRMILGRLADITDEGREKLKLYGLTLDDVNPTLHSIVDIFRRFREVGMDVGDLMEIFSVRSAAAAANLLENVEALDTLTQSLKTGAGITATLFAKSQETASYQLQIMKNAIDSIKASIGEGLLPILKSFATAITFLFKYIGEAVRLLIEPFNKLYKSSAAFKTALTILVGALTVFSAITLLAYIRSTLLVLVAEKLASSFALIGSQASVASFYLLGLSKVFNILSSHGITINMLIKHLTSLFFVISISSLLANRMSDSMKKLAIAILSVAGAVTTLAYAFKVLSTSNFITLIISIAASIVTFASSIKGVRKAFRDMGDAVRDTWGVLLGFKSTTQLIHERVSKVADKIDEVNMAIHQNILIGRELNQIQYEIANSEGKTAEEIEDLTERYKLLSSEMEKNNRIIKAAIPSIIETMKGIKEYQGIGEILESYYTDLKEFYNIENSITELQNKHNLAMQEYSDMLHNGIATTSELIGKQNEINQLETEINEKLETKSTLYQRLSNYSKELTNQIGNLRDEERKYIETIVKTIKDYMSLLTIQTKVSSLQSKVSFYLNILKNRTELYSTAQGKVELNLWKVYKAELALYQIRYKQRDALEEVYEALFSSGVINEELINSYVNYQQTVANTIAANQNLFNSLKLTPEAFTSLIEALRKYIETSSYTADSSNFLQSIFEQFGITNEAQKQAIIDWISAQRSIGQALDETTNKIQPLATSLYETGALTEDISSSLGSLGHTLGQTAEKMEELREASQGLSDALNNLVQLQLYIFTGQAIQAGKTAMNLAGTLETASSKIGGIGQLILQPFINIAKNVSSQYEQLATSKPWSIVYKALSTLPEPANKYARVIEYARDELESAGNDTSAILDILNEAISDLGYQGQVSAQTLLSMFQTAKTEGESILSFFSQIKSTVDELSQLNIANIFTIPDSVVQSWQNIAGASAIILQNTKDLSNIKIEAKPEQTATTSETNEKKVLTFFDRFWNALKYVNPYFRIFEKLQHGGYVTKPTLALLGESGPEAVIPLKPKGTIQPGYIEQISPRAEIHFYGDVHVHGVEDWHTFVDQISKKYIKV